MKREDAFYYENLLILGLRDEYDKWLDSFLETENPLSEIVVDLASCGSDVNKIISVLHGYCMEQPFDETIVCNRFREFFKKAYHSNQMNKDEVVSAMYTLASNIGAPGIYDMKTWGSMYYTDDYYSLAKEGIISWNAFDSAFLSYLNDGVPLNSDSIWNNNKKNTLLERIKRLFKK